MSWRKGGGGKKHITCLLAEDGTPPHGSGGDGWEGQGLLRKPFFPPESTNANACRVLWDKLPMVSTGNRDQLELPLTLAKFSEALCRMPTNKSPGMDGLTVEFYRVFWDVLGLDLVSRVLPLSCNTDYKVVAKAISLRLESVLADVVHPDQTYTVPGRTILDNLYLVWDLLELGCRDGLLFALLSLDQEKAFDRVDHGRLMGLVLREPELRLVLSAYADDVLLLVPDPGDLVRVEACQAIYSAASSPQVNWVKSSGLVVGDGWQASSLPPTRQAIRWSAGPLLYLGIYLSAMHPSPPENWHDLEGRVIERLQKWTGLL
ncbi:unnamed protein product [Caretta caretta]